MPGDFSRKTFDAKKHYSAVQKQQGRVDLDADWNEQNDINHHRTTTETIDVIGHLGVPKKGDSFKIVPEGDLNDLAISSGHIYVGGLLCELDSAAASYFNQPYNPAPDGSLFSENPVVDSSVEVNAARQLKDGNYLVYIDAWQREVNYLDDALIQEVALGEADTATRLQNVWQVKLLSIADKDAVCKSSIPEWDQLIAGSNGLLNARTHHEEDSGNPCVLPPSSGFRRLENQLYRVEVQRGGNLANTTFKWSRDNATVETRIEEVKGSVIRVASVGRDEVLGFAGGQWVEVVSAVTDLQQTPNQLVKILSVNPALREITLSSNVADDGSGTLKLRRWDQSGGGATADGVQASATWTDLEDGVQVFFSEGTYRAGDYWLIPARVATGEIEWPPYTIPLTAPEAQHRKGIKHFYGKLALLTVNGGKLDKILDCRPKFPSLTEICAEDICFNNNNCNFPQANNVQEALDLLCAANDLREHNRLLHGAGVICGLKIKCRPARTGVTIEKGYALDCEGNMIRLKNQNGLPYNLVEQAKDRQLLDEKGNGRVCLTIAKGVGGQPEISVEKYEDKGFLETILEGTLLKDFYEDCIKNLFDFLKDQFSFPVKDEVPVPMGQRRLTAVVNLLAQEVLGKNGGRGFISGNEKGSASKKFGPSEDLLLRKFYKDLKEILASETFCAMYDNDTPYPEYLLDDGLDTIFGTSLRQHMRLRVSADGKFGYTAGKNNKVYVYDLGKQELVHSIDFPGDAGITIEDIAFLDNGRKIIALGRLNDIDSVFATGNLKSSGKIDWAGSSTIPSSNYVSLGTNIKGQIFCICQRKGLYEIRHIGKSNFSINLVVPFNATGLLAVSPNEDLAVAAEQIQTAGAGTGGFNSYRVFRPGDPNGFLNSIQLSGEDLENDLLLSGGSVYATGVNGNGERVVGRYDIRKPDNKDEVNIGDSWLRLAEYSFKEQKESYLLVTIASELKVVRIKIEKGQMGLDNSFAIPVQPFPVAIVVNEQTNSGYVLNTMVNTLTVMDLPRVFHDKPAPDYTQVPPVNLVMYRQEAVEAFKDVLSHILQYLKDCFCDKFLIDCPECGEDDKVYLGCVEIREEKVYNICNFNKRKYVKSFPTVGYWLSTVPVIPMVNYVFTKLCCKVFNIKEK